MNDDNLPPSTCGLTECAGKPMCVRCKRMADMDAMCSLLPEGVHWGDPLTPEVLRAALAAQPAESVAWLHPEWAPGKYTGPQSPVTVYEITGWRPLYAAPQPLAQPPQAGDDAQTVIDALRGQASAARGVLNANPGSVTLSAVVETWDRAVRVAIAAAKGRA